MPRRSASWRARCKRLSSSRTVVLICQIIHKVCQYVKNEAAGMSVISACARHGLLIAEPVSRFPLLGLSGMTRPTRSRGSSDDKPPYWFGPRVLGGRRPPDWRGWVTTAVWMSVWLASKFTFI
jgi:hypothetical protein